MRTKSFLSVKEPFNLSGCIYFFESADVQYTLALHSDDVDGNIDKTGSFIAMFRTGSFIAIDVCNAVKVL